MTKRSKKKVIAHLVMWAIIGGGGWFVFYTLPKVSILTLANSPTRLFLFLVGGLALYEIVRGLAVRMRTPMTEENMPVIIKSGDYAKCAHPSCVFVTLLAWGMFFLFSTLQFFVLALWITAVVFFWIKLEEQVIMGKSSTNKTIEDAGP